MQEENVFKIGLATFPIKQRQYIQQKLLTP